MQFSPMLVCAVTFTCDNSLVPAPMRLLFALRRTSGTRWEM